MVCGGSRGGGGDEAGGGCGEGGGGEGEGRAGRGGGGCGGVVGGRAVVEGAGWWGVVTDRWESDRRTDEESGTQTDRERNKQKESLVWSD